MHWYRGSIRRAAITDRKDLELTGCSNCGGTCNADWKFCPHCGAPATTELAKLREALAAAERKIGELKDSRKLYHDGLYEWKAKAEAAESRAAELEAMLGDVTPIVEAVAQDSITYYAQVRRARALLARIREDRG